MKKYTCKPPEIRKVLLQNQGLRDDIKKKKSKKQEFGPLSVDPYPPTIKREVLIRDIFDFFPTPTLLIEIGTFLKKN